MTYSPRLVPRQQSYNLLNPRVNSALARLRGLVSDGSHSGEAHPREGRENCVCFVSARNLPNNQDLSGMAKSQHQRVLYGSRSTVRVLHSDTYAHIQHTFPHLLHQVHVSESIQQYRHHQQCLAKQDNVALWRCPDHRRVFDHLRKFRIIELAVLSVRGIYRHSIY